MTIGADTGRVPVKVKGRRDPATVLGRIAAVAPGEKLEASGRWSVDPERGIQFRAETIETQPPASASGIERYLASGFVRGIGQETAKKLVAAFGKDTLKVLDTEPKRLDTVPGLTPQRVRLIKEGWSAQQGFRDVLFSPSTASGRRVPPMSRRPRRQGDRSDQGRPIICRGK